MKLIDALCSGIRGAENGHVELYKFGASTRATWYADFEGTQGNSTGNNISLDANGSAVVFVGERVLVDAKDANGNTVREFVAGEADTSVEVRSTSFTGTDYATLASALGNPTTLRTVLDAWITSAGQGNWQLTLDGVAFNLKAAISRLNGPPFYNVKADAYGAKGDNITQDLGAIQQAIDDASAAGGGVVFFPEGVYRLSANLNLKAGVHLLGAGVGTGTQTEGTWLSIDHASSNLMAIASSPSYAMRSISGIGFTAKQANTGLLIATPGGVEAGLLFSNCFFGGTLCRGTDLVETSPATFLDCGFEPGSETTRCWVIKDAHPVRFARCTFKARAGAYNPPTAMLKGGTTLMVTDCEFNMTPMTSGSANGIDCTAGVHVVATGNYVKDATGGNVWIFNLGTVTQARQIYEDFNNPAASAQLYNLTTFTAAATPAWNLWLGSRERRIFTSTANGTPITFDAKEYAQFLLLRTDAVAQTWEANFIVPNGSLTIMMKNKSGGAGATITTAATSFRPSESFSIAGNNNLDVRRYRGFDNEATLRWTADSTARNNI